MSETVAPSLAGLFAGYLKIGLLGFGGVNALSRRVIVEERRWMSERDYAELLGLGQALPGPNVGNAAVMIGRRFHGLAGALVASAGLYAAPLAVLLLLARFYASFGQDPAVEPVMRGIALAAAGMVIGTVLRAAERLRPPPEAIALGLLAVLGAAVLRAPLWSIVLALGPVGVALAAWRRRTR